MNEVKLYYLSIYLSCVRLIMRDNYHGRQRRPRNTRPDFSALASTDSESKPVRQLLLSTFHELCGNGGTLEQIVAAAKAAQATLPQAEVSHPLKDWYTADVENLLPLRAARDAARLVVREQRPNDKQEMVKMREDLRVARARYRTAQQEARQKWNRRMASMLGEAGAYNMTRAHSKEGWRILKCIGTGPDTGKKKKKSCGNAASRSRNRKTKHDSSQVGRDLAETCS